MPSLLQEGNDLLALITDAVIWHRLVGGGLQGTARQELTSALEASRSHYRHCRADSERGRPSERSRAEALDAALFADHVAVDALERVIRLVRDAGCRSFHDTASLEKRFTAPIAQHESGGRHPC